MTSIDNRIVQMQFDNAQFEKGAKQSLNTLDRIKKSLDFSKTADSFSNVDKAINNIDLSGISTGIAELQNRFSTWGIVGMQVISELTSAAINMGKKLANMSIGQIITGGKARASNIQKAQLMLEGLLKTVDETTGQEVTDFEQVNNTMADATDAVNNTAYGLDEAALVASQLAASGIEVKAWSHDLTQGFDAIKEEADPMARSLMAVSGLAAMTSSSYSDIGQIFTTVAGNGKLMSMQLQQLSGRGVNAAATMAKAWGKTEAQVREMVSDGKVTFQMFSDAMYDAFASQAYKANRTLTGVLSNTKAALSKIGADLFTPLIQNTSETGQGLTNLVQVMDVVRAKLNELRNAFSKPLGANPDSLDQSSWGEWVKFVNNISTVAKNTINKIDAKKIGISLFNISSKALPGIWNGAVKIKNTIKDISTYYNAHFGNGKTGLENLATLIERITHIVESAYSRVANNKEVLDAIELIQTKFRRFTFSFTPQIGNIVETIRSFAHGLVNGIFNSKNVENILKIITNIEDAIINFASALDGVDYKKASDGVADGLGGAFTIVLDLVTRLSEFLKPLGTILGKVVKVAIDGTGKIGEFISKFKDLIESNDELQKVLDFLKSIVDKIADLDLHPLDLLALAVDKVHTAFENLLNTLKDLWDGFKQFIQPLIDGIKDLFKNIFDAIQSPFQMGSGVTALDAISTFIKTLAGIKLASLGADLVNVLVDFGKAIQAFSKNINGISASNLKTIAESIGILAVSLLVLSSIDGEKLGTALGTIAFGLGEIVAAFYMLKGKNAKDAKDAVGKDGVINQLCQTIGSFSESKYQAMLDIAGAILIMAVAMKVLSTIQGDGLESAIAGMSAALVEMVTTVVVLDKLTKGDPTKAAKSAEKLAWSLVPIALALKVLSSIEPNSLAVGLFGMATALGVMSLVIKSMSKIEASGKKVLSSGASIMMVAFSLLAIAGALALLQLFDYTKMGQAMTILLMTLAGIGTIIGIMSKLDGPAQNALAAAASILLVTLSLIPIVAALAIIDLLDPSVEGIVTLLGVLTLMAATLAGISSFGLKAVAAAAALAIVAASLVAIALALKIVQTMDVEAMGGALLAMIVTLGTMTAALVVLGSIAPGAIVAAAALLALSVGLLAMAGALKILSTIPLDDLMSTILGIAGALGIMAAAGVGFSLISPLLLSAAAGVAAFGAALIVLCAGMVVVSAGLTALSGAFVAIATAIVTVVTLIVNGIVAVFEGIEQILEAAIDCVATVVGAIYNAFCTLLGIHSPSTVARDIGIYVIEGLIEGLLSLKDKVEDALKDICKTMSEKLNDVIPEALEAGKNFVGGLINGITSKVGELASTVWNMAKNAVKSLTGALDEHSPSKITYKAGEFFDEGFANGVDKKSDHVFDTVQSLGDGAVSSFKLALSGIQDVSDDMEFTPTITPVLDLSQIQNGSSQIASMFDNTYTMRAASAASSSFVSPAQIRNDNLNNAMSEAMKQLIEAQSEDNNDPTYTFNIPLEVNGRQIAKATRSYTRTELDNLNTIMDRKAGIK